MIWNQNIGIKPYYTIFIFIHLAGKSSARLRAVLETTNVFSMSRKLRSEAPAAKTQTWERYRFKPWRMLDKHV